MKNLQQWSLPDEMWVEDEEESRRLTEEMKQKKEKTAKPEK